MPQQSKVEKEILADIEVDQSSKSKRREFREKIQERADRRKQRQEEKGRVQKESRAKKEDRKKQKESQRFAESKFKTGEMSTTSMSLGLDDLDEPGSPTRSLGFESVGLKSETTSVSVNSRMLRSATTTSVLSPDEGSDGLPDSDDEGAVRRRRPMSRQTTRMSLAKGQTTSGLEEAGKKRSGTISGVLSGSLQSTGKTMLKTGTTIGLLLGVVPSKNSRDFLRRKVTRLFPSKTGVSEIKAHEENDSSGSDHTEDSEAERIKEKRRQRFAEKASKSWGSMENAGENVKARAREAVGYPENEEDWTCSLKLQRATGILWFRMVIAIRKIAVAENPPHPSLKAMVESLRFEAFIGALIVVNGIISGIDAMYLPEEAHLRPAFIPAAEYAFVVIFVLEYFLRLRADTWVWMFEPMNMFDTFVVWITGVLVVFVLEPFGIQSDYLRRLAALRVLRLGRLARAVRTLPMFHELWMLVSGVLTCTKLLFWSFVIIFVVHFMFAVVVMETITTAPEFEEDAIVQNLFGSLFYTMFTLFQFMTFDSWAIVARPIIYKMPLALPIFFLFLGIAGIVLVNLMTAIVVKNAFEAADADEEAKAQQQVQQQAKMAADLRAMFEKLDEDGSGTLTREEFTDVLDDVLFIRQMKVLDIDLEELPDIFDILDDGDGNITTEEFCLGLTRLQGVAMSRDMLRCTSRNRQLNTLFDEVRTCLGYKVDKTLGSVELNLEEAHVNLVEMQQMTAEVLKKLEEEGLHQAVRSTTTGLEEIPPPTLEDIAKREEEAQKQRDLARLGRGQTSTRSIKPPVAASENYPAIPSTWVLTRKKKLEERKHAMRAQQWEDAAPDVEQSVELPGVLKEMQAEWAARDLHVAQKSREERMMELKAEKKEEKIKILPAKLPAVLAPRKMEEEEVEGPEQKDVEAQEAVKKDVNKMNIKELKEMAESLGLEHEGLKKVQLLPLVAAKMEEVMLASQGKAIISTL